jgi:hypothetical protein
MDFIFLCNCLDMEQGLEAVQTDIQNMEEEVKKKL